MEGSRGSSSALCWCGCCELQLRPSLVPADVHRGGRPPPQSYARVGSAGVWPGLGSGLPVSRQVTVHTSPLVFRYLLNRVKTILTYGYTQHPAQGPSTQYPAPSPGGSRYPRSKYTLFNLSILMADTGKNQNRGGNHHHHHQKAFRNKSHTSHGHRPGLKRNKSKGKRLTMNYSLINYKLKG